MRRVLIFIILIFTIQCSASAHNVVVFTDYSPVRIMNINENEDVDVEASKAGLSGARRIMDTSELPSRADRDFWYLESGIIKVDHNKKQAAEDAISNKRAAKTAALNKLKSSTNLTDSDLIALGLKEE